MRLIVLKKRKNASDQSAFEDAFGDAFTEENDLFSSKLASETSSFTTSAARTAATKERVADKLFQEQYKFAIDRLSPNPAAKHPLVRNNAIKRLLHHSSGAEHLERIVDLLVLWRNAGRRVDDDTTLEIIGIFIEFMS